MINYRENQKEYAVDTKERSRYEREEYLAQNEYAPQNNYANQKNYANAKGTTQIDDLDSLLYYKPQETNVVSKPTQVPAPKAKSFDETDDSLPSQETLRYRSVATQDKSTQKRDELSARRNVVLYELDPYDDLEEDKQYKINTKGKVLIAVYAIVVLTVFALIIINTSLLQNMNNDVAMLQYRIEQLNNKSEELSDTLDYVSSDEEIERKASELGMTK